MSFAEYQPIKFVSGPFEGLTGKTLSAVPDTENWYVEVKIGLNPVIQEVPESDIAPL
jgi:transcription antitermination factor NusG